MISYQTHPHSFHIPVLGLCYTVDTPARVAHLGISSVISIVDDILMEKMREFYCKKFNLPFQAIPTKTEDHRARRITAYLDTIQEVVRQKFENLKKSVAQTEEEIDRYIKLLPDMSALRQKFNQLVKTDNFRGKLPEWVNENLVAGDIDVNIMSKLDRDRFEDGEKLPVEFNDAHAALRGFAKSQLNSSLVLSAGMNPRLYSYIEEFDDFYPDENLILKKRIILKVSDYRSALVQGRFLAKKGIWVSEYRVESGLNCGGHAFATDGYLMGPVLEEFKNGRTELVDAVHSIYVKALHEKGKPVPEQPFQVKITAQGGVGTAGEHQFLIDYYELDSVGWGTPFLLVPDAVSMDHETRQLLCNATEEDLYLSEVSPLGVLFNNVRGNSMDRQKEAQNSAGKPGYACTKKYLALAPMDGAEGVCTASKEYQRKKIQELNEKGLSREEYDRELFRITDKACLCNGLTNSILIDNELDTRIEGRNVIVCPGPNLAYFNKTVSLDTMVDHIYGRTNIIERTDRPNMFLKELKMCIDYLGGKIEETIKPFSDKQKKVFQTFQENLVKGADYYKELFQKHKERFNDASSKSNLLDDLEKLKAELAVLKARLV